MCGAPHTVPVSFREVRCRCRRLRRLGMTCGGVEESSSGFKWRAGQGQLRRLEHSSPALPARSNIEKQATLAVRPQGSAFSGVQPRLTLAG